MAKVWTVWRPGEQQSSLDHRTEYGLRLKNLLAIGVKWEGVECFGLDELRLQVAQGTQIRNTDQLRE